ncbi:MAG TPA: bifunctional DNA primase/polymerase [Pseudonocardia sp.]|jgi:hypothetical protein|nr:bifunctional DNA primase/polymerase [Pseudonocardia sp.]
MNTHRHRPPAPPNRQLDSLTPAARTRIAGWIACAEQGWDLFPIAPARKAPPVFEDWRRHATTDPQRLLRYFAAHPRHNAGIACGPSGLIVIDCDLPKTAGQTTGGAANLAGLATRHGHTVPATYTVATPSGGTHLYFLAPEPATGAGPLGNTSGLLAPLIDTRGDGGYVLAPGSSLAPQPAAGDQPGRPGGSYELLDDTPPVPLPIWLHQALSTNRPTAISAPPERVPVTTRSLGRYLAAVLRQELDRIHRAGPGHHNAAVFTAARALGQLVAGGALDLVEAEALLTRAAMSIAAGPCDCTTRGLAASIRSGLAYGARRPRRLPTVEQSSHQERRSA